MIVVLPLLSSPTQTIRTFLLLLLSPSELKSILKRPMAAAARAVQHFPLESSAGLLTATNIHELRNHGDVFSIVRSSRSLKKD